MASDWLNNTTRRPRRRQSATNNGDTASRGLSCLSTNGITASVDRTRGLKFHYTDSSRSAQAVQKVATHNYDITLSYSLPYVLFDNVRQSDRNTEDPLSVLLSCC